MKKRFLLSLLVILVCTGLLQAQTWTGTTSSDWNTAANWDNNTVPLATDNVTIPGTGITNWPQLTGNITVANLTMNSGSQLDVNGFPLTASNNITVNGATLNNSSTTTDIVVNLPGNNETDFGGATINDHISFTISGNGTFDEGYPTGNHFTGNAIFNISGTGNFTTAYQAASQYDGNLSITRTAAGNSTIFQNGNSTVGGNFSFGGMGGTVQLNPNSSNKTSIAGMVNIINSGTNGFTMNHLVNNTTGGTLTLQNTGGTSIQNDTLLVSGTTISVLKNGITFQNNKISGTCSVADDATNTNEIDIGSNYLDGNFTATISGNGAVFEGFPSGNHFTGNATFNISSTSSFYTAWSAASQYDGNLGIARTAAGNSTIFQNGNSTVGGNFSFSSVGGATNLGNSSNKTSISGTVNISNSGTDAFTMNHLVNNITGGTLTLQNTGGTSIQNDTLLVSGTTITGLKNGITFQNNKISGTCSVADDATNTNEIDIGSNYLGGNFTATISGSGAVFEGFPSGNHFTGNATFNISSTSSFYTAWSAASQYDGNLGIARTAAGNSTIFQNGNSTVGGNFSFSSVGGATNLGNSSNKTSINGTVNISNSGTNTFAMNHLINNTTGGTIAINTTGKADVEGDTLLAAKVSLNGLSGIGGYSTIYQNSITADSISISDNATAISETVDWGGNLFSGNFTATFQSAGLAYDGVTNGNHYAGNTVFNHLGSGQFTIGYANNYPQFDKDFSLNEATPNQPVFNGVIFGGAGNGHISQSGTQPVIITNGSINKTGGATLTLNDSVLVNTNFNFVSGNVISVTNKELIFGANATATNTSDASYADGPVVKTGNVAFTFPSGNAGHYAPIGISAPANVTDQFTAQYFYVNPQTAGYDTSLLAATLNHVSKTEYWLLDRTAGTSNVVLTLSYSNSRSHGVDNQSTLRIAHWIGGLWADEGTGGITGTVTDGTIQSAAAITSFSPFTLGSVTVENPLPLRLISFTGATSGCNVVLNWQVAEAADLDHFDIQYSNDGSVYKKIGQVKSVPSSPGIGNYSYTYEDAPGIGYYRLCMIDKTGGYTYSRVQALQVNCGEALYNIVPNPAQQFITVNGRDSKQLQIVILNGIGQVVKSQDITTTRTINIADLAPGLYMAEIKAAGNVVLVTKLIKE